MGAKYFPTIKDLKASQRFQQNQQKKTQAKKAAPTQAPAPKTAKQSGAEKAPPAS